jgi:predicted enzyme related to lactoylglutathione lyase
MDNGHRDVHSQITFLYYDELDPIDRFYRETLGLELVEDQGWAKIYATGRDAFLGIVRGDQGFHRPQEKNAVLVTLVVDDVRAWYNHLQAEGANLLTAVKEVEGIQVRGFFLEDPGGYTLEIQQFLDPSAAAIFHGPGKRSAS